MDILGDEIVTTVVSIVLFVVFVVVVVLLAHKGKKQTMARPQGWTPGPVPSPGGGVSPPPLSGGVTLTGIGGPLRGKRYDLQLTGRTILGRNPQVCDVVMQGDDMISGRHCEFSLESGSVTIRDLGSLNGTIINGVTITNPCELKHGDVLLLGETEFKTSII